MTAPAAAPPSPPEGLVTTARGPGLRARARRGRLGIVAAVLLLGLVAMLVIGARPGDYVPLSTENSTPTGTRALAQILRAHGVEVRQVDRLARSAVRDPAATTVVIAHASLLTGGQLRSLVDYPGDLVLLGESGDALAALGIEATEEPVLLPETVEAGCADPDALAAGTARVDVLGLEPTGGTAELCFTQRSGLAAFARADDGARTVTAIASAELLTNAGLDSAGHAALAIRSIGAHPEAVWYVADGFDPSLLTWVGSGGGEVPTEVEATPDFLPPGTGTALYALALAVLVAAFWRARRFGALVREPLPVEVRASEATRGRARLYRRARATGRSAASLRAAAALRMGRRLGVGRADGRDALLGAVARATGRAETDVDRLLYGPPPADDAALLSLISELDALESEVHRP
ncbi:DUF4350 domain-containing protein [Demequina sp. SYSU T00192]|uniref:DUF4350 domain-containing protein n=1 Tax=Demequina litoralis TaxID=3051660 RepID=A0ABT8G6Z2_9MICO|nr:DUF4350 domain-containing protein [Demequina sp. SYSU T00192]MDN4474903.1 DUF4350 domain-containing protein [Demequina sp. SYSU T00192]